MTRAEEILKLSQNGARGARNARRLPNVAENYLHDACYGLDLREKVRAHARATFETSWGVPIGDRRRGRISWPM